MLSEGEGGTYCLGGINAVQITFKDFMNHRRSCVALDLGENIIYLFVYLI